jgi:hypothetical protein
MNPKFRDQHKEQRESYLRHYNPFRLYANIDYQQLPEKLSRRLLVVACGLAMASDYAGFCIFQFASHTIS